MNRTALVRKRAALARRQAEIDARLAMMSDAKKTPERRRPRIETTAERSLRRNVDQYMVHLKHAASLLKEYLQEQPKWVDREFVQQECGRRARGARC